MATIDMDVREIRRTVYGRDMREPIADACIHINDIEKKTNVVDIDTEEITGMTDYYRLCFSFKT